MVEMVAQPTKQNFGTRIRSCRKSAVSALVMLEGWEPKDTQKRDRLWRIFSEISALAKQANRINEGHE